MEYFSLLNTREQALIIWIVGLFVLALSKNEFRNSFLEIFKTLLHKIFLFVFAASVLYLALIIFIFNKAELWDTALIPGTIFWFFGSALILLFSVSDATRDNKFFKKIIFNNLKLTLIIGFLINIYTFHLITELILLPIILLIAAVSAVAEIKNEYSQVKRVTDFILVIFSIFLITFAVSKMFGDYANFVSSANLQTFVLSPLLTIAYLPFLYFLALFMAYESLFVRLGMFSKENERLTTIAKKRVFKLCHLNLWKLNRFVESNRQELMRLSTEDDIEKLVKKYK